MSSISFLIRSEKKFKDLSEKLALSTEQTIQATGRVKYAISDVAQGAVLQNEEITTTLKILESLLANINLVNQKTEESTEASERTVQAVGVDDHPGCDEEQRREETSIGIGHDAHVQG